MNAKQRTHRRREGAFLRKVPNGATGVNLTPLIDVVLLLLIFFMLTSPMVLRSALPDISPPETVRARAVDDAGERITLDSDDRITLNGVPVDFDALKAGLSDLRRRSRRVMVLADAGASLGATIRVMDACALHDVDVDIYATPSD